MVRQYVGARYVPKFANPTAWTSGTSYEAMTIVTYNNSSYTSKIQVPPTVGNPADNPQYWALTGNYNAQVEEYRQATESIIPSVKYNLYNTKSVTNRYFLFCGDSYGSGLSYSWVTDFANMAGLTTDQYTNACVNGTPFWSDGYLNELKNFSGNKNNVTDILLCAGANDIAYEALSISIDPEKAIEEFIEYAKANYPNANVYTGVIGTRRNSEGTSGVGLLKHRSNIINAYKYACAKKGGFYLSNVEQAITSTGGMISADGVHPTEGGMAIIAQAILEAWSSDYIINGHNALQVTWNGESNNNPITATQYGDVTLFRANKITSLKFTKPINITMVEVGGAELATLNDIYFDNPVDINVTVIIRDSGAMTHHACLLRFTSNKIYLVLNEIENGAWKSLTNCDIIMIGGFSFSVPTLLLS